MLEDKRVADDDIFECLPTSPGSLLRLLSHSLESSGGSESFQPLEESLGAPIYEEYFSNPTPALDLRRSIKCLRRETTESSEEPSSLLSSSSLPTTAGRRNCPSTKSQAQLQNVQMTAIHTIKRRPRLSDLHQHESTSDLPSEYHPADSESQAARRLQRRSISANAALQRSSPFTYGDRYLPQRRPLIHQNSTFRTSRPPCLLKGRELYTRARDESQSPFRSVSASRSRQTAERQALHGHPQVRVPQYTPSFIHGRDARPVQIDTSWPVSRPRQISQNSFWVVGGRAGPTPGPLPGVTYGDGRVHASGTNAPLSTARFLDQSTPEDHVSSHESRLALALDIDQATRILPAHVLGRSSNGANVAKLQPVLWQNARWQQDFEPRLTTGGSWTTEPKPEKAVPTVPFRVLDAPHLKDDYYCSVLAYCHNCRTLAVALTHKVYLWTEQYGVRYPPLPPVRASNFVTSLAFSSHEGDKNILAVSRHSGSVTLWSLLEQRPRFELPHPNPASCLAFKTVQSRRTFTDSAQEVSCEELAVGDDCGLLYLYSIKWPSYAPGSVELLVKIKAHSQNLCGLAWSPDGASLVTGGNDNCALLFDIEEISERQDAKRRTYERHIKSLPASSGLLQEPGAGSHTYQSPLTPPQSPQRSYATDTRDILDTPDAAAQRTIATGWLTPPTSPPGSDEVRGRVMARGTRTRFTQSIPFPSPSSQTIATPGPSATQDIRPLTYVHRHVFMHSAAVKALAFAPWQPSLLATGGGSNDRQIHFHHTTSGATLAVINVFAQVTSLVWSTTRREIAATFGYAQPEHDIRIAVFSWPDCQCVVSIPWERKGNGAGEIGRALWAIAYPGGPNDAVSTRGQEDEGSGFSTWEEVRRAQLRDTDQDQEVRHRSPTPAPTGTLHNPRRRGSSSTRARTGSQPGARQIRPRSATRGEGETWASRTQEEGSLIIACCDMTVKFFEVWAGKSKGNGGRALGNKEGVLGGSRVLEGWCEEVVGVELEASMAETIR